MSAPASRRALLGALAALPALNLPAIAATDPHVAYRERLHVAHGELCGSRPIGNVSKIGSWEEEADKLVHRQMWRLADEVLSLPVPSTMEGLGVIALAQALMLEGCATPQGSETEYHEEDRATSVVRAILALTGEALPRGFAGFGDEPDYLEREYAAWNEGPGTLPAWAVTQAKESRS